MSSHTAVVPRRFCVLLVAACLLLLTRSSTPVSWAALAANPVSPTFVPYYFGGVNDTRSIAVGDVNGDGALDIVQGNGNSQQSVVYLNDGAGNFGIGIPFGGVNDFPRIVLGDVNGDGVLDIVVADQSQQTMVYINNGIGGFDNGAPFGSVNDFPSIALGDVNGDGALDVVQGNSGQSVVYLNNGEGGFGAGVPFSGVNNIHSIALGDVNGDGALDVVQGNYGTSSVVYLNNGVGSFGVGTPFGDTNYTESIALGDVNGDGALDIIEGNSIAPGAQSVVYLNDGAGDFRSSAGQAFGGASYTASIALGDVNGDGALDVVQGNGGQQSVVYLNLDDGVGNFGAGVPFGGASGTTSIALGDVNGDGALDVVQGNIGIQSAEYLNSGAEGFGSGTLFGGANNTFSLALGDVNGDGALDIVQGNSYGQRSMVYLNDRAGSFSGGIPFGGANLTRSIALGDVNGDSALDIVQGNGLSFYPQQSVIYLNDRAGGFGGGVPFGGANGANAIALGDVNGDGALDIVQGNYHAQSAVYLNNGAGVFGAGTPFGSVDDFTQSIALGDVNGDGALDIVQGNSSGQQSMVYLNTGNGRFGVGVPFGGVDYTLSIALGDVNGDGALDIIKGNYSQRSTVYLNDGSGAFGAGLPFGSENATESIALGDANGDGALDIVQGSRGTSGVVYLNDGAGRFGAGIPLTNGSEVFSIALGDVNGDGTLDIVQGNQGAPSIVYPNTLFRSTGLPDNPPSIIVTRPGRTGNANFFSSSDIISNTVIPITYTLLDPEGDPVKSIRAYYSPDGGGKWYTATASSGTVTTNLSTTTMSPALVGRVITATAVNTTPLVISDLSTVTSTLLLAQAGLIADLDVSVNLTHTYDSNLIITLTTPSGVAVRLFNRNGGSGANLANTIFDDEASVSIVSGTAPFTGRFRPYQPLFAADGSAALGPWRLIIQDTVGLDAGRLLSWGITTTLNNGRVYTYAWDTFQGGFFGESDNVVFRMEAYPSLTTQSNGVPVFQHPYASSTTFPFRVRGTQVQVLSGTQPISNALVYRLPAGQSIGALPFADLTGIPYHTDGQGYLQGRGQIGLGDRLVALYPITATDSFTLYYTSAAPTLSGLNLYTVTQAGVQTLVVSSRNPLILFNLDVSLEWDARQDTQFLSQLHHDLQRASEFLYDWSNGQAALGHVTLYFDREKWDGAHIRLYATDRLRPNAEQGGLVTDVFTDPITSTIVYNPGQVRMGAVWTRYGDSSGALGEDWPRALAHELSHYALFLDDDYLGLDANHYLIPIDTCVGTAMSDPYREDYSEYRRRDATWQAQCGSTLAAKETSRADWETVTTMYHWLTATVNAGPSGLPLNVTEMVDRPPITPTTVLPAPIFNLTQNGAKVQPGLGARAILYQQNNRLIDLGNPTLDQVNARGARLGDRLCVYEASARRLGCETLTAGDEELTLVSKLDWQPDLLVSPVNSQTINLGVNVPGVPPTVTLRARLYPVDSTASPTITLVRSAASVAAASVLLQPTSVYPYLVFLPLIMKPPATMPGYAYVGTFALAEPAPQGYVQLWVDEPAPRRESVIDYALGGNPAYLHGRGAYLHGRGAYLHGRGAYLHGRGAPAQSSDGQVLIFGDGLTFNPDEFFALQALTAPPAQPPGTTLVGQAYHLLKSAGAPSLSGTSISFSYAGRDVPAGEEDFLHVYYWNGVQWQKLPTVLNTTYNVAVAPTRDVGVYALLSSIEIPLHGPGWTTFGYPAQGSKLVTQALSSISGSYGIVYGTALTDTLDPWKVYAVNVPAWVNDLATLDFGKTYWISVTRAITLQVTGGGTATPSGLENLPSPPMTVYGTAPISGMVTARVNGVLCGQSATKVNNSQIVYTLNIQPDAPGGKVGCGAAGRNVTFKINSQAMSTTIGWDIDQVRNVPLMP